MIMFSINSYGQSCPDGSISWILKDSILTISGTGNISNYLYDPSEMKINTSWDNYRRMVSKVVIESGITGIGDNAFRHFNRLSSITIPNSITCIGEFAFSDCVRLLSIDIPNSVTSIGDNAFYNCTGIVNVEIPNSIISLGDSIFAGCNNLTTMDVYWEQPIELSPSYSILPEAAISKSMLIVPDGTKDLYEAAYYWQNFGLIKERSSELYPEEDATANNLIDVCKTNISLTGDALTVDSSEAETVNIYSIAGALVFSAKKGEGKAYYSVNIPNGIYIVTGSNGWNTKVLKK